MIKFVQQSFAKGNFDVGETDYVKYLVSSCLWMNLISLVFKYIGYLIYIYFGKDYSFFDFVYLFFHAVADSIVISILIFVSYGWTITFLKDTDFDLYVPLGIYISYHFSMHDGLDHCHINAIKQDHGWRAWQVSHVWHYTIISFGVLQIYYHNHIFGWMYQNYLQVKVKQNKKLYVWNSRFGIVLYIVRTCSYVGCLIHTCISTKIMGVLPYRTYQNIYHFLTCLYDIV